MATRAYVLRIESIDSLGNGNAILFVRAAFVHDDNPGADEQIIDVPFSWSDNPLQLAAKIATAVHTKADSVGYIVGPNDVWVPTYNRQ